MVPSLDHSPQHQRLACGLFAVVCSAALISAAAADNAGVPDTPIDYSLTVDQWWSEHPMNPAASAGVFEVRSPEPVIEVKAGDSLQKAIDNLPASGGTLRLAEGEYEGGFEIIHRANIHLLGQDGVVIRGGQNFVIGAEINREYGEFCLAASQKKPDAVEALRDLPTHNIYIRDIVFDESPVRLGSCRSVLMDRCTFRQPENWDAGEVDADGKKVMAWKRRIPVTGIMGLQNIWFRDCDFSGHNPRGFYLDGAQGSGVINCRFADSRQLWRNAILLMTNDDCSLDMTGDGELAEWERRDIRYFVADGCHFGGGYNRGAIAVSGRDVLAQNCTVDGNLAAFMVVNAKTSGKPIQYEAFGIIVRNNQLDDVKAVVIAEAPKNRPEKGLPDWWVWTKFEIGRFTIVNNRINAKATPLQEKPGDDPILGPHTIEGNGPDAVIQPPPTSRTN